MVEVQSSQRELIRKREKVGESKLERERESWRERERERERTYV